MTSPKETKAKIDVLTSLRFFAAFLIVVYHARDNFNFLSNLPEIVFSQGVTFFFILSGFILTYVYPKLDSFKEAAFYFVKRLARIWPLHLTILICSLILLPGGLLISGKGASEQGVFLANLFMLQSWVPNLEFYFSYNSPSWSISTEMFFYLAFPLLLLLSSKRVWLPLAVSSVVALSMIILASSLGWPGFSTNSASVHGLIAINPLSRLLEFATGMSLAVIFKNIVSKGNATHFNQATGTILEFICLSLCFIAIWKTNTLVELLTNSNLINKASQFWLSESGIVLVPFSALIILFALRLGGISKLLENKFFVYLGEISFAVYLVHYPILQYLGFYMPQQRSISALIIFIAILLLTSHLLYRLVEMPSRYWLTRLYKNWFIDREKRKLQTSSGNRLFQKSAFARTSIELSLLAGLVLLMTPKLDTVNSINRAEFPDSSQKYKVGKCLEINNLEVALKGNALKVDMLVSSTEDQEIDHFISYQILDRDGNEVKLLRSRIAPHNTKVESGKTWKSSLEIPLSKDDKANKLGIIIANKTLLDISGGLSDMNGKRLILPLDKAISKSQKNSI